MLGKVSTQSLKSIHKESYPKDASCFLEQDMHVFGGSTDQASLQTFRDGRVILRKFETTG